MHLIVALKYQSLILNILYISLSTDFEMQLYAQGYSYILSTF